VGKVHLEFIAWLADTVVRERSGQSAKLYEDLADSHTIKDLLVRLARAHPEFERVVFDSANLLLNSTVAVYHNGRQIELKDGLETELRDGDTLILVPIIAGG
jgi:molybdopterin converting factor small subunit